jgi:hypothetical protein
MGVFGRVDTITYELNDISKVRRSVYEYTNKVLSGISIDEASTLNSTWNPYGKILLSEADGIETSIIQNFDANTNSFFNSARSDIKLDDKSNRVLEASYIWDTANSTWKGYRTKLERTYIDTGVISSYSYSDWDSISGSWKIYSQGTISYAAFKKPEEIIYSAPNNADQLVPSSKIVISYNGENEPVYETTYLYDGTYNPVFRTHFEYAQNAPQYIETIEEYNSATSTWRATQKTEKSFSNGELSRHTVADLDTTSLQWKERFHHEFSLLSGSNDSINVVQTDSYNGTTLLTRKVKQITDANGLSKMTNTFEADNIVLSTQLSQISIVGGSLNNYSYADEKENYKLEWNFDSTNNIAQSLYYKLNDATNQMDLIRKTSFNLTKKDVAIRTLKEGSITFGPNPVSDILRISNSTSNLLTYKIVTLEGKPVVIGSSSNQNTSVDASRLQPGAYILQLSLGKNKNKSSLIIKK